jgi:phenylpyruvate tautomerase PptA (4-oxalocrotonate tautomerase family)
MPLVRISLGAHRSAADRRAIADTVQQALVDVFDVPPDDRFQIITAHGPEELIYDRHYLGIDRSDDFIAIQITCSATRTLAQKRALYARIADQLYFAAGVRPEDVFINLVEVRQEDWSFGNGRAQYVAHVPA